MNIDGLTREQVLMLDRIWSFETREEFLDWRYSLGKEDRRQADTLLIMLGHEYIEEEQIARMTSYPDAEKILKKIQKSA